MAKLTKQDINKVYFRNLFILQFGWDYEKMQGFGYAYVIVPALKRFYGDGPDKMKKALEIHLTYFNTTSTMSYLITGAGMVLEEEIGIGSKKVIMNIKTGLMGPFAGVGDTLFIAIYRVVVFSTAAYIALEGNPVGLLVSLIARAGVLWVRYKFTTVGYNSGQKLATGFTDKIVSITEAVSILGLTVMGALVPSVIEYDTNLQSTFSEVTLTLQGMLDKTLPCMLLSGIVMPFYWLLGRKKIDSIKLIFILIDPGVVLGNLQSTLALVVGSF